jgi:hypothetical protein
MKTKKTMDVNQMGLASLTHNELVKFNGGGIIAYSYFIAFGFATGGVGFRAYEAINLLR